MKISEQALRETNLLLAWSVALAVSGVLIAIDVLGNLRLRLAMIPRPGLNAASWPLAIKGVLGLAPLLLVAIAIIPVAAGTLTYFVLRARRTALSSHKRGSFTDWWDAAHPPRRAKRNTAPKS